jgi:hypothetical protein
MTVTDEYGYRYDSKRTQRVAWVAVNGGDSMAFGNANFPGGVAVVLVEDYHGFDYLVRFEHDAVTTAERFPAGMAARDKFWTMEEAYLENERLYPPTWERLR